MTALDWFVIAGGLAAIAWVLWYFFRAERGPERGSAVASSTAHH